MHDNTHAWLSKAKKDYPEAFTNAKVLEIGSYNVNGTARGYFDNCDYIGVDIMEGKDVDLVVPALETNFKEGEFDTLVSVCMFEHDADWRETIVHNKQWLKKGGYFVTSFGAEGCHPHFYPIFVGIDSAEFTEFVKQEGFEVLDAFFEHTRFTPEGNPTGIYDMILRKL